MTNQLALEKSPYLLQHANNPVDWRAWNLDSFRIAQERNQLVFLSIGYSTCHWCHVMERESFENQEVAQVLNDNFIAIKVDREELPDVDQIYMEAIHMMGQHGGWPLNVFLTPDRVPFFGGTYFPRANFIQLLQNIQKHWQENPEQILEQSQKLFESLKQKDSELNQEFKYSSDSLELLFKQLKESYEPSYGGFSRAPKFPVPMKIRFLLQYAYSHKNSTALEMAYFSLDRMARGGLQDHLGGGFSRYSTDEQWLAPHFEKMLYDNAGLALAYTQAYQVGEKVEFKKIAEATFNYVITQMQGVREDIQGAFYSAEDADSEGVEGKFYTWHYEELKQLLSQEQLAYLEAHFGISVRGNFEGSNILNLDAGSDWQEKESELYLEIKEILVEVRNQRVRPHLDDKILTSWNGLMIKSLAYAARAFQRKDYLLAAQKATDFILDQLFDTQKNLLRRYRDGQSQYSASLEDYAFFISALIELYLSTQDESYLLRAVKLQEQQIEKFWDPKNYGFFFSEVGDPLLITRKKDFYDNAMPSANSVSAMNLAVLSLLCFEPKYKKYLSQLFQSCQSAIIQHPIAFPEMIQALSFHYNDPKLLIVVFPENIDAKIRIDLEKEYQVDQLILFYTEKQVFETQLDFLKDKKIINNQTTYYLCHQTYCEAPRNKL